MKTPIPAEQEPKALVEHLGSYVSEHKRGLIEKVLNERTRYLTVVLEDIVQAQNASAVVRTCECLGVQDIHIIENQSWFEVNRKVLRGSYKWITFHRYKKKGIDNTADCLGFLRSKGYSIWITDPSSEALSVQEIALMKPVAMVFGNELRGVSDTAREFADRQVRIPMYGFTESFNISVSAAILLSETLGKLRQSEKPWPLSDFEKAELRINWYRKCVRNSALIEKQFERLRR